MRLPTPLSLRVWSLVLGLLGWAVLGVPARAEDDVVSFDAAEREIAVLEDHLRSSRAVNDEIVAAIGGVAYALDHLPPAPTLTQVPMPEDATEEQRAAIRDENRNQERTWKRALRKYERQVEQLRDDARDLFLDALAETKVDRASEVDIREPVNIAAARVLGRWPDPVIARKVQRTLERSVLDGGHEVSQKLLDEAFTCLARLGDPKSLAWMIDEFTHTRSTPERYVDQLVAAHRAMRAFPLADVPGDLRHELVEQMIRNYAGVESQAEQSSTDPAYVRAKVFWDRIRRGVINVLQRYAGEPKNAAGVQLATVREFQEWFREHKDARQAPWTDSGAS